MSNSFALPDYHYSRLHKWASNMWDKDAGKLLKRYIQQFMISKTSLLVKTNTIDSDYINIINQTDFSNKEEAIHIFLDLMDEMYKLDESRVTGFVQISKAPGRKKKKSNQKKKKKSNQKKKSNKKKNLIKRKI